MAGVVVRLDAGTAPHSGGPGSTSPPSRGDAARAAMPPGRLAALADDLRRTGA